LGGSRVRARPQLIINGGFDVDENFNKGAGWTIVGGVAVGATGAFSSITQPNVPLVAGVSYEVEYEIVTISSGGLRVLFTGGTQVSGLLRTAAGIHTQTLTALTGNVNVAIQGQASGFTGTVDNLSVRIL